MLTEVDFQVELAWSHGRRLAPRISMLSLGDVPPNKPLKLTTRRRDIGVTSANRLGGGLAA